MFRGEIPRPTGDFPESLSQAMLVGIMLAGYRIVVTGGSRASESWETLGGGRSEMAAPGRKGKLVVMIILIMFVMILTVIIMTMIMMAAPGKKGNR